MSVSTIHDILAQFRDEELHNRHLGDRFERLIWRTPSKTRIYLHLPESR